MPNLQAPSVLARARWATPLALGGCAAALVALYFRQRLAPDAVANALLMLGAVLVLALAAGLWILLTGRAVLAWSARRREGPRGRSRGAFIETMARLVSLAGCALLGLIAGGFFEEMLGPAGAAFPSLGSIWPAMVWASVGTVALSVSVVAASTGRLVGVATGRGALFLVPRLQRGWAALPRSERLRLVPDAVEPGADRVPAAAIIGATVALFSVPVLLDLALSGRQAVFRYFATDAFYYLNIARNFASGQGLSFDGEFPTNGFHPLWQLVLAGLWKMGRAVGASEIVLLYGVAVFQVVAIGLAVILLGQAMLMAHRRVSPLLLALPVGLYALSVLPLWLSYGRRLTEDNPEEGSLPLYGTLWSYVNGMESSLAILLFALAALLFVRGGPSGGVSSGLVLGAVLGLLTLARLDLVFIPIALAAVVGGVALRRHDRRAAAFALATASAVGALVVVYLLWNRSYAGSAFPVSGASKSSFPIPTGENWKGLALVVTGLERVFWLDWAFRLAQMLVPFTLAAAFLIATLQPRRRRRENTNWTTARGRYTLFLIVTALSVLALAGHNWLFMPYQDQGNWSYQVATLSVSLMAIELARMASFRPLQARPALVAAVVLASTLVVFGFLHRRVDFHEQFADLYFEEAPKVREHYGGVLPKLLEYDDGIVGFSLGSPTMSGLGLALDQEAAEEDERGELRCLAARRGFARTASLVYWDASPLTTRSSSVAIKRVLGQRGPSLEGGPVRVEYLSASGSFAIVGPRDRRPRGPTPVAGAAGCPQKIKET